MRLVIAQTQLSKHAVAYFEELLKEQIADLRKQRERRRDEVKRGLVHRGDIERRAGYLGMFEPEFECMTGTARAMAECLLKAREWDNKPCTPQLIEQINTEVEVQFRRDSSALLRQEQSNFEDKAYRVGTDPTAKGKLDALRLHMLRLEDTTKAEIRNSLNLKMYENMKRQSENAKADPVVGGRVTNIYHIYGDNSRVNVRSTDQSVNITSEVTGEQVFLRLREKVEVGVSDDKERAQILARLGELEITKGQPSFVEKYQLFVAAAANHMTLLAPFIPALTKMLTGG